MKILELHKKSLAALLLPLMALVMLPGCSTTEEEEAAPPPEESRCMEGDSNYPDCLDANI